MSHASTLHAACVQARSSVAARCNSLTPSHTVRLDEDACITIREDEGCRPVVAHATAAPYHHAAMVLLAHAMSLPRAQAISYTVAMSSSS